MKEQVCLQYLIRSHNTLGFTGYPESGWISAMHPNNQFERNQRKLKIFQLHGVEKLQAAIKLIFSTVLIQQHLSNSTPWSDVHLLASTDKGYETSNVTSHNPAMT